MFLSMKRETFYQWLSLFLFAVLAGAFGAVCYTEPYAEERPIDLESRAVLP